MEKQIVNRFGRHYLLGRAKDSRRLVWLEAPSWDCGWYWGFGYLHEFSNDKHPERSADINAHFHFDGAFLSGPRCSHDQFKEYFGIGETTLTDAEIWQLCDYMQTFYTLKEAAELFCHGYSWQTEKAKVDALKRDDLQDLINKTLLPEVFKKIENLLSPTESK